MKRSADCCVPWDTCAFESVQIRATQLQHSQGAVAVPERVPGASLLRIPTQCCAGAFLEVSAPLSSQRSCRKVSGDYWHFNQFISIFPAKRVVVDTGIPGFRNVV